MGRRLPVNCRGVSERCPPTRTGLRYSFTRSWSLGDANLGREVGSANSATPPDPRNCDGRRHLPDHVLWNSAPSLPSLEGPDSQILQAPTKVSSPLFSPWGPHPPPRPPPPASHPREPGTWTGRKKPELALPRSSPDSDLVHASRLRAPPKRRTRGRSRQPRKPRVIQTHRAVLPALRKGAGRTQAGKAIRGSLRPGRGRGDGRACALGTLFRRPAPTGLQHSGVCVARPSSLLGSWWSRAAPPPPASRRNARLAWQRSGPRARGKHGDWRE